MYWKKVHTARYYTMLYIMNLHNCHFFCADKAPLSLPKTNKKNENTLETACNEDQ